MALRDQAVGVALVGVTGYGAVNARRYLDLQARGLVRIAAFVEPAPERDPGVVGLLRETGAVGYADLADVPSAAPVEAAVISTPIHLHRPLCLAALSRGWHVQLEKPAAATVQDLREMIGARQQAGRIVAVNFQHTARPGFRYLQVMLHAGRLGKVRRVTCTGIWCREDAYYSRTQWAGRLSVDGHWVLDGTVMNPFAHLINNGLIAAASQPGRPAAVAQVTAELYHANPIESEDTSCLRILTENGVEVLVYATLAGPEGLVPAVRVEGSAGTAVWDYEDRVTLRDAAGRQVEMPPFAPEPGIAENFLAGVRGQAIIYSPLEASVPHLQAANGAFLSCWPPAAIPEQYSVRAATSRGSAAVQVPGIAALIDRAALSGRLFSELGVPWAKAGKAVAVRRLDKFDPQPLTDPTKGERLCSEVAPGRGPRSPLP